MMMVTTRLMIKINSYCDPNQAPTTVSTARLVLLVPPSPPLILHSGVLTKVSLVTEVSIMMINIVQDGIVGPLNRGGDLSLKCKTEGGCITINITITTTTTMQVDLHRVLCGERTPRR